MLVGDLRFDEDTVGARESYAAALTAWGKEASTLARRANVTYNLAALDAREGEIAAAVERFGEARALALRAGDKALAARIGEVLESLESER